MTTPTCLERGLYERIAAQRRRGRAAVSAFVSSCAATDASLLGAACQELGTCFKWKEGLRALLRSGVIPSVATRQEFALIYIRNGDHIREHVNCDLTLIKALRLLTPPYKGKGITLYRGETARNRRRRTYSLSWSASKEVAECFAADMRTCPGGSVLLVADVPADAIICRVPGDQHYALEREFLVDRRMIAPVRALKRFSDGNQANGRQKMNTPADSAHASSGWAATAYEELIAVIRRVWKARWTDAGWANNEELRTAVLDVSKRYGDDYTNVPLEPPGREHATKMMRDIIEPRDLRIADKHGVEIEMWTCRWALAHLISIYDLDEAVATTAA